MVSGSDFPLHIGFHHSIEENDEGLGRPGNLHQSLREDDPHRLQRVPCHALAVRGFPSRKAVVVMSPSLVTGSKLTLVPPS